ncbi:MAG: cobalamin-binding protein [Methylococcaceae bacterium]
MTRKLLFPFLTILSLLLGACVPTGPAPTETLAAASMPPTAAPTPTQKATPVPAFPMTITDGTGREVTLEAAPARIVSLSPSNTEILFAVGAGSLVVADTTYCDFPIEAQKLPKIGGFSAESISIETILSLKPDLVLANGSGQEAVITALEQAKVKVVAVSAATFEDVYANIEMIGKVTGHNAEAAGVLDNMKASVASVAQKIASIPQDKRPTVFWEVWDEPLMTAGPGTFTGQMIEMAGGVNLFAELSEDYPQVSAEEVIKRNPAFILGPDSHGDKLTVEQLAARPGWEQIAAVKENKIFLIDGDTSSRPGPRLADALEAIAKSLYPDLFK